VANKVVESFKMQFKNLFVFTLLGGVFAQQAIIDSLHKIDATLDALDDAVAALASGANVASASKDLVTKSTAIQGAIQAAIAATTGSKELSVAEAANILTPAKHLQDATKKTIDDLIAKKADIAKAGQSGTVKEQLTAQAGLAKQLAAALVTKVPAATKSIAQSQGDAISAEINRGLAAF
jgi:hypothetical protein